jgi:hypothetical protein
VNDGDGDDDDEMTRRMDDDVFLFRCGGASMICSIDNFTLTMRFMRMSSVECSAEL